MRGGDGEVFKRLRDYVLGRIHTGSVHAGDRLPSYRELSAKWSVDHRVIARAYRALQEEGLVQVRGRSGVYLSPQEKIAGEFLPETARWAAEDVLTEALKRRIRIPELPEFIRRCTQSAVVRAVCIESTEDHRHVLCGELGAWYGFEVSPVAIDDIQPAIVTMEDEIPLVDVDALPPSVRNADLLVTFSFHGHLVRSLAEALDKPFVTVTLDPAGLESVQRVLERGTLTLVCVDPELGQRLKSVLPGRLAARLNVVLAHQRAALRRLENTTESLLVSDAARDRLGRSLTSILENSPTLSSESASELSHLLIRFNLEAESPARDGPRTHRSQ